jgi:alanine transaminase
MAEKREATVGVFASRIIGEGSSLKKATLCRCIPSPLLAARFCSCWFSHCDKKMGQSPFTAAGRMNSFKSIVHSFMLFAVIFTALLMNVVDSSVAPPTTLDDVARTATKTTVLINKNNKKRLNADSMFAGIVEMEYAVRGKLVILADKISEELKQRQREKQEHQDGNDADDDDDKKKKSSSRKVYTFDKILYTNIGNPHALGQQPLTWPRQVLALVELPNAVGVDHPLAHKLFPVDAIERAREMKLALGGGGSGAYSHSKGTAAFRQDVARFIQARDGGVPANADDIYLTNGASSGIAMVLNALIANPNCGVMIPIPQYPLYSATIDLHRGQKVGYYLNEENGWQLDIPELERALQEAADKGIIVNSLVLINPGNPSGSVLTRENLHQVVQFCARHHLVVLADEVYQENVYDESTEFISCKRAAHECGLLDRDEIELISFHSTSKGVFGECGRRGGYMELVGIDPEVKDNLYKLAAAFLCSTVSGQVMTSLMVRGLKPGDVSYESHQAEMDAIFQSLKRRSQIVGNGLNAIPGFSCQPARGAMYGFPAVKFPQGVLDAAEKAGCAADALYCLSLLEKTGICVVPASGFATKDCKLRDGFRTTILPNEESMAKAVERIREHYADFCAQYKD